MLSDLSPRTWRRVKYLSQTSLVKWNLLTQKLTIFIAEIIDNDKFLSLHRNSTSSSLSPLIKKNEMRGNRVWYY